MTDAEYLRLFEEGRHGSNKPAGILRGIRKCLAASAVPGGYALVPLEPTQATAELPKLPPTPFSRNSGTFAPLFTADQMNAFAHKHGERRYADGLASRADVARLEAELRASRAQSGEAIPADEPVFIFRARDKYAASIIDDDYARMGLLEWAVTRWREDVQNRPMMNIYRPGMDKVWRQVIRHFGGDPDSIIGPAAEPQS